MKIKVFCVFIFAFSLLSFSCNDEGKYCRWDVYSYDEYNGFLYTKHRNETITCIICANVQGIQGHMKIKHNCTEDQFKNLPKILNENGIIYKGQISKPDTKEYPDLSPYLTFIFSRDELHHIWNQFGLE